MQTKDQPIASEMRRLKGHIEIFIPKEWEIQKTEVGTYDKTVVLHCFNRPVEGFESIFEKIRAQTGYSFRFHTSSSTIIQDAELIEKIRATLPSDCILHCLRWKPHPNFFGLEISGKKLTKDELHGARQILKRPVKVERLLEEKEVEQIPKDKNASTLSIAPIDAITHASMVTDQIRITPFGACGEVGRSCFLFDLHGSRVLLDCGAAINDDSPPPIPPEVVRSLNAVILSHVHRDHSGMLPWLYEQGCRAPLISTKAGFALLSVMLHDSYRVQKVLGRKSPFSQSAIAKCMRHACYLEFERELQISPSFTAQFLSAGHVLGASMVLFKGPKNLLYTGDFSASGIRSLPNATQAPNVHTLLTEATYGDRDHLDRKNAELNLVNQVEACCQSGGTVIIPSFAVGRAQEILMVLAKSELLGSSKKFPVYADGTLLHRANNAYLRSMIESTDAVGPNLEELDFALNPRRGFVTLARSDNRHTLLYDPSPKVIVTTSGMGNGPALTYIRHFGNKAENLIIFVGYQAPESIGYQLLKGAKQLKLENETLPIRAKVDLIGFSAHADRRQLLEFIAASKAKKVIPIHGDLSAINALGNSIEKEYQADTVLYPKVGETIDLMAPN